MVTRGTTANGSNFCFKTKESGLDCRECVAHQISICSQLGDEGLSRLHGMSSMVRLAKNQPLFEQDRPFNQVFVITDGTVKVYRLLSDGQRQVTGFIGPGDLGGLKSHSGGHCSAQAVTNVSACAFPRAKFLELLHDYQDFCLHLLIMATDEIEAQHDHVSLLGRRRSDQRLAAFLLLAQQRWSHNRDDQISISLPMPRTDLADYLGQSSESLSRAFHHLKRLGHIDIPKPAMIILKNLPALSDLAGFDEVPLRRATLGL